MKKSICAWCNVIMKSRRIKGIDKDIISHGICPKCAEILRQSIEPAKTLNHQS